MRKTRLKHYAAGGQIGIWEQISQIGDTIGQQTSGDKSDQTMNYIGNWQRPTHMNALESFKTGDINEIGDNVFLGGLFGTTASRQADEYQAALKTARQRQMEDIARGSQARYAGYDQYGTSSEGSIYALGGQMGGQFKPLNSDTVEVDGNTHEQGGVKVPFAPAEVEDKETITGNYVFSDALGFADRHKKIATQIGAIEKKPINPERKTTLEILRKKEQGLKQEQETVRAILFDSQNTSMGAKGKRVYADGGALYPYFGQAAGPSSSQLLEGVPSNFGYPKDPYLGSGIGLGYTNDFSVPSIPSAGSSINDANAAAAARKKAVANKWESGIAAAAPYITNVVNSMRKLPAPAQPAYEATVAPQLVNYDGDRVAFERRLRAANKGVDTSIANPGLANAQRAANIGNYTDFRAKLAQQEGNTNASIVNDTRRFNSTIGARNVERTNDYNQNLVNRDIAQQQYQSANLADATNKYQAQRRDFRQMDLEQRKFDALKKRYKDSGVVDRNLLNELLDEETNLQYAYGGSIQTDPSKRGAFTAATDQHGMGMQEFADKVLLDEDEYTPAMRKKRNAAKSKR